MSHVELSSFSLSELKALQKQVAKAIEEFSDKEKARALAALEEKARELGFSLAELTGGRKGARKTAGIAKYRHPDDASVTWTGKGRRPDWLRDALARGVSLDDLAV